MSVPNQTPYIIYNANGLTTVFPFEFYIINANDIQISLNGEVISSGYSVSGVGNIAGGDVIFLTPPANGTVVMLERVVPTYRLTDYQDNGDLLADTVNKDFDRLWMAIQRSFIYLGLALRRPLFGGPFDAEGYRISKGADPVDKQDFATKNYVDSTSIVKALRVPENFVSSLPPVEQRKNKIVGMDANGQPIMLLPESGSAADVLLLLAGPDGYQYIPSVQIQRWRDVGDIRGWGAIPGQDATNAINAAIRDRAANDWGTSSDIIMDGHYQVNGEVLLTTDVRIVGNWATITSTSDDWIIKSAYKNSNGDVVNNFDGLTDEQVISSARLKGTQIKGVTFVDVSKVFKLQAFSERCSIEDVSFQNCGTAWDARLSFYAKFSNIIIRGVKQGYENSYAYQLRHQCNDTRIEDVKIAGRKFGRLIDDDITPSTPGVLKNCQNVIITGCSYEQLQNGSNVNITTYGYKESAYYAEDVSDNLFVMDNGEHHDTLIDSPVWAYGVEKQGTFNNLKGRSYIYQAIQRNYNPPKRSGIQLTNSTAVVFPVGGMGAYSTVGGSDYGISFDVNSKVAFDSLAYTQDGVPVAMKQTNLVSQPVNISGFVRMVDGKAIGVTGAAYTSSSDTVNMSTDIYWSNNNLILVAVRIYQTSVPTNTHSATAILMNGAKTQLSGQPVTYVKDGDLTTVRVANPAEGGDKTWLNNGDFTVEGCVRLL